MRVLIAYDSVSPNKNTEKVAEAIRDVLKTKGMDAQSSYVKNVVPSNGKDYDCLIVGSPTHAWRATDLIRDFLNSLTPQSASGKQGAAFDTRIKGRLAGSAKEGIENKLKQLGFNIILPGLVAYVKGEKSQVVLMEGELEKARQFAEQIAAVLH